MSDYVYESGMSTKRRRQRRTAITLLLTLLFLFGAFWWAWSYIRDGDGSATATPTASPMPTTTPTATCIAGNDPKAVTINVYNATDRSGLARRSADQLAAAGFIVGAVANDPQGQVVEGVLLLRHGAEGAPFAAAFKEYYQPVTELAPVERPGTDLDLVLGNAFEDFAAFPTLPPC